MPGVPAAQRGRGPLEQAAKNFPGAPRPLEFDDQGREVLTFLEGETVGSRKPWPAWTHAEDTLDQVARWTRAYHQAVSAFMSWTEPGRAPETRSSCPAELGGAGRQQGDGLGHVPPGGRRPTPNPAATCANGSPLRWWTSTSTACCPGFSFRHRDPIEARCRRMIPATKERVWRDNGSAAR